MEMNIPVISVLSATAVMTMPLKILLCVFVFITMLDTSEQVVSELNWSNQDHSAVHGADFEQYTELISLDLSKNSLSSIFPGTFCDTRLEVLDISNNALQKIPDLCCLNDTLALLLLATNSISRVQGVHCLTSLHYLDLSHNLITDPFAEPLPPNLQRLLLDDNPITNWSTLHIFPEVLESISLCSCNIIDDIAQNWTLPTNLKSLNLTNNKLSEFPAVDSVASNLTILKLEQNKLTSTPIELFTSMHNLETCHLQYNKLRVFPVPTQPLAIRIFKLYGNDIPAIQSDFARFYPNLSELRLQDNYIITLPDTFPSPIKILILHSNLIQNTGTSLVNLPQLSKLNLERNDLNAWPDLTWSTYNIKHINMNSNNIISIPTDALIQASKLRIFSMSNNSLTVFPNITSTRDSLCKVDLQFNFIGNIPEDNLLPFSTSPVVQLRGNNLHTIPDLCQYKVRGIG